MNALTEQQRAELERWATALESGKYQQATSVLHTRDRPGGGYCCLGVYADICGAEWIAEPVRDNASCNIPFIDGVQVGGLDGDEYLAAKWMRERTGIAKQEPLSNANDNGMTFKEIAAFLREFAKTGQMPRLPKYRS